MNGAYPNGMMSHMQAPHPPPIPVYEHGHIIGWRIAYGANNSIPYPPPPSFAQPQHFAPPCSVPQPSALSPAPATEIRPPHREWDDLSTLEFAQTISILQNLTTRCATARETLDSVLIHLETVTQIFLATHSPMTSDALSSYLHTFTAAQMAGRNIFAPQEAYRTAITTLGLFLTDVIDMLPKKSTVKKRVRREFDEEMERANGLEEGIRRILRGLVNRTNKRRETYALAVYMGAARQRFGNWRVEEERCKTWAGECIGAML